MKSKLIPALTVEAGLKRELRRHLANLGFSKNHDGSLSPPESGKEAIRQLHWPKRVASLERNREFIAAYLPELERCFARGTEIDPGAIRLTLDRVSAGTSEAALFRLASLIWSVPVSGGYGRRLRYLVWDRSNAKLAGIIALGDPVFNLTVRDSYIGWNAQERAERLVNILDAYILGAVPPYNFILTGKAIACLLRTREVYDDFKQTYGTATGLISGVRKNPRLLAVTTSSALGRSSVYNRLRLGDMQYMVPIGYTEGWGHFHIPDHLFDGMRRYLRSLGHGYADKHRFGQGPNWRLRTIRVALKALGFDEAILRHGVRRQVFISELAKNARQVLRGDEDEPDISTLELKPIPVKVARSLHA
jgi:hypothetical protein